MYVRMCCMYVCTCICVYVCVYVCMLIYIYIYIYIYMCVRKMSDNNQCGWDVEMPLLNDVINNIYNKYCIRKSNLFCVINSQQS
jgi:hypothetical protein